MRAIIKDAYWDILSTAVKTQEIYTPKRNAFC